MVGEPDPETEAIWELNVRAFSRACELMKTGATWGEVEAGVKEVGAGSGYDIDFLVQGRGLGNEGPMLIPVDTHAPFRGMPLKENSAFVVKPFAYADRRGLVTRQYDVTWGDTVVVKQHGAVRLGTRVIQLVRS